MPAARRSWPVRSRSSPSGRGRIAPHRRRHRRPNRPFARRTDGDALAPARPPGTRSPPGWPRRSPARSASGPTRSTSAAPLAGFGIGSLQAVRLAAELEEWLGRKLAPTLVYDYPTIDALARFPRGRIDRRPDRAGLPRNVAADGREPIAIIGIGCRFPGADGPDAFWRTACETAPRRSARVPASRWDRARPERPGHPPARRDSSEQSTDSTRTSSAYRPREAVFVDPQQRMLLEVAWEALEDGGQVPERLGRGARRACSSGSPRTTTPSSRRSAAARATAIESRATAASIAANRISHCFDFRGPSLAIDTACSSSLVAVHLACRSIWDGESELALAGGREPDPSCRRCSRLRQERVPCRPTAGAGRSTRRPTATSAARGRGWWSSSRSPGPSADGDPIYAVIRGGAVNQDGRTNGLTAPSRPAQEAVLRSAYRQAGVAPGQVDYVEAHGTGTPLGDPIELAALGAVLAEGVTPDGNVPWVRSRRTSATSRPRPGSPG